MFNQDSAQQDKPSGGSEITSEEHPVRSVLDQSNTEESIPSVDSSNSLPWYLDMKYFWKQNKNGNGSHLAPLPDFVKDVITEGDRVILLAGKDFTAKKSGDMDLAKAEVMDAKSILETRKAYDAAGIEAQDFLRFYLKRCILARKIAGASEVSAQHRIINARLTGQDEERVKASDYFQSDVENRNKWAFKACRCEFITRELADGEIIKDLPVQIVTGVENLLYNDSIQATNRLRNPAPISQEQRESVDMDDIRAATA